MAWVKIRNGLYRNASENAEVVKKGTRWYRKGGHERARGSYKSLRKAKIGKNPSGTTRGRRPNPERSPVGDRWTRTPEGGWCHAAQKALVVKRDGRWRVYRNRRRYADADTLANAKASLFCDPDLLPGVERFTPSKR